ncbi:hypothetical protein M427DRAFT_202803 [Gonapodya prolifera JEL478]|uniref:Uncharacterized protein n=1 Tax=Gonapodya prolifera (strain JEL478) TaxID=1344416 RepID=A0A138ZZH4_GONPJ|nr:hypothetical protein M427DRAFT_202803 [Gonapodya prolifera JEL478]|eukprot:KXS09912.1 hypothetical protein M427DRAFT_202803 [Gonapodya prolifera JEL478]
MLSSSFVPMFSTRAYTVPTITGSSSQPTCSISTDCANNATCYACGFGNYCGATWQIACNYQGSETITATPVAGATGAPAGNASVTATATSAVAVATSGGSAAATASATSTTASGTTTAPATGTASVTAAAVATATTTKSGGAGARLAGPWAVPMLVVVAGFFAACV